MSKERAKKITTRANGVLSKSALLFLVLLPVLGVLQVSEICSYSTDELILYCGLIVIFSTIPCILNKIIYDEKVIAFVTLVALEALCMIVAVNPFTELSMIYVALPVVSLLYCDRQMVKKGAAIGYIGMIIICIYRTMTFRNMTTMLYRIDKLYLTLLQFTLEYLIFVVCAVFGAARLENWVLEGQEELPAAEGASVGKTQERVAVSSRISKECPYDVESFFFGIERDMLAIIKGKEKSFELEIDPHLPVRLYGDKKAIRQALSGICSDLLMYRAKASIKMEVTYDSGITPKKGQNITLIVRVSGITDITAITANKTALGYYLSKSVIEDLKGSFEDLSDAEEAIFKIRVLQRVEDATTIGDIKKQQFGQLNQLRSNSGNMGQRSAFHKEVKILVVDDNREVCKLVSAIANSMGVLTESADTGAKALQLLESQEYQMVFLDQMMPEKSGLETVQELRFLEDEYYQKLPVVLLAVNTSEEAKAEYLKQGFSDCVSKPIKEMEIKERLHKWIKDDYPITYAEYIKMQEKAIDR
ncbi:MAG: response regulator [Lachnospiraceae bacterium]|nr:response regulator [Lachnospiraceae bacterium]